jgi:S1-C subfamily serine protease
MWDDKGHIVTNYHVVAEGNAAHVTLSDQSTYPAKLIGHAVDKDIAVLRMEAPADKMVPLALGRSDDVRVGQQTLAIGNPFGLDHTLSTGVISGLEREIKSRSGHPIFGVIQTDAAINPGNSGGPLLDSRGRVIAINTAIYSPSGASAGIGFAVPIGTIERIVPQLIQHGRVVRPGLGIEITEATNVGAQSGVVVMGVQPGTGAAAAGVRGTSRDQNGAIVLGDVIVAIDNKPVRRSSDLLRALDEKNVGDVVNLSVRRDGATKLLAVKLSALNP